MPCQAMKRDGAAQLTILYKDGATRARLMSAIAQQLVMFDRNHIAHNLVNAYRSILLNQQVK